MWANWETAVPKKKEARSSMVRFRVQPALRDQLEELAGADNRTLSSWLETHLRKITAASTSSEQSKRNAS
jgi:molybdopterin-guanine dinucleotide biosynthesis protein A